MEGFFTAGLAHDSGGGKDQRDYKRWHRHTGALIGVGGLGEPIICGLNLNVYSSILQGAIPAAPLALLVLFVFDELDRLIIPRGLRLKL